MTLTFKTWLAESEAKKLSVQLRPQLSEPDIKRLEVEINDIVEMGPETEFKGAKINKIAKVVEIKGDRVFVRDLTKSDSKLLSIPIKDLHDKEELRGTRIIPREEAELKALGGKRLWVKLTPRQYKKYAALYRAPEMPEIIPMSSDEAPSKSLKRMFSPEQKEKPEILSIFDEKPKSGSSPLKRYIAKKKGIFGMGDV